MRSGGLGETAQASGSASVKVLPSPGVLLTVRSPRIPRARSREIARLILLGLLGALVHGTIE
jgi:hypothetical protein